MTGAIRRGLPLLLTTVLLAGRGRHDEAQRELNRDRRVWPEQGISDHRHAVRRSCFCDPAIVAPVVAEVRGGREASRSYRAGGGPVPAERVRSWPEVAGLFDEVQAAIDRNAASIEASYHPRLGYPARVRVDLERRALDEEQEVTASEPTPPR